MTAQYSLAVKTALEPLVGSEKWADVNFVVGRKKTVIPAHRPILAASSKILEAMVYPTFGEDEEKGMLEIALPTIEPAPFRAMLRAIYTNDAKLNETIIQDCLEIAQRFHVEIFKHECAKFLKEGLTVENVCTMFENAPKLLGDGKFALKFIENRTDEVIKTKGWRNLSASALVQILKSSRLSVEEVRLWQAVLSWTMNALVKEKLEDTVENKRRILKDILPLIRFPTMRIQELVSSVQPTGILSEAQMLKLFTYLGAKGSLDDAPDLGFPLKSRSGAFVPWTLSTIQKSTSIILSDENKVASNTTGVYAYLVGDVAFTRGRHCWRVNIQQMVGNNWILLGIGAKKHYVDNSSYNDPSVYGFCSHGNIYVGGVAKTSGGVTIAVSQTYDLLLDLDAKTLQITGSGGRSGTLGTISIAPIGEKCDEYAPHFVIYQSNVIRVESIPTSKYGFF